MTYGIMPRPKTGISKRDVRSLRVQLRAHGIEEGLEMALSSWLAGSELRVVNSDDIEEGTDRGW